MSAKKKPGKALATLPVAERAVVALGMQEREKELVELAASTTNIIAITNSDGYKQIRAARIALKNMRLEIQATGKAAREDATAFSKAVIAEEKRLVALIEPEEERLGVLQDAEDARVEAERQAEIDREIARQAALQKRVDDLRALPNGATRETSAQVQARIDAARAIVVDESFEEMQEVATNALETSIHALVGIHVERVAHEVEQKRISDERAELARLRAEAAERERQENVRREAEEARHAEQLRRQAEEAAREQRERQRLIDEENARARAEQEAAAKIERERLAAERAELERQQKEWRKVNEPLPTLEPAQAELSAPAPSRFDINDDAPPTRDEIVSALCGHLCADIAEVLEWLAQHDWRAALAEAA